MADKDCFDEDILEWLNRAEKLFDNIANDPVDDNLSYDSQATCLMLLSISLKLTQLCRNTAKPDEETNK